MVLDEGAQTALSCRWDPADTPDGGRGLLLHGTSVIPELHPAGVGSRLLDAALQGLHEREGSTVCWSRRPGMSRGFFRAGGLASLPVENPQRDYPFRFWKAVGAD